MRVAAKGIETETLFEILTDRSPIGLYIVQDGKFCYTNPTFQSITGYREDELLNRDALDLVIPEDREMVRENAIKMLNGKLTLPYQFRVIHKDGSIKWIVESIVPIHYRGRQAVLGTFLDTTERKQTEAALQIEKNKLQSLIDSMEDTLTIQDTEYNIIYQNESSKRASGGDHLGEKCYRAYEGREMVCDGCPVEEAFKDGKPHTAERRTVISGKVAFWENTANPIRDAGGRIVSCLEIGKDITERKKAEEELSKTQAQLSSAVQIAHLGPWEYDAINGLFIFNDAFYELFHTTADEVGGYTMSSAEYARRFVYPEDAHLVGEEVRKALQADDPNFSRQLDHRIIYADGEVGYISVRFFIVKDETGRTVRTYGVNQDITERKRAEEALETEKNKLQSVIDAMEDDLTIQDTEYNIIFQNEPSKISSGGDHAGEKCYRVYEGQESICEDCPVEKAFKDGKPHTSERQRVTPSGEVAFLENTANPIRDAKGRVVSCLEISRNITERKKQEQALADELTRRRLLVDQSLDGIVVLDVDAKVVEANQRFADMLGYTLEEVRELHTWDWDKQFPPEKLLEMGRGIDEKGLRLETKHTRKDGSVIDVDISISAAMFAGQKLIFCVCRDVTARNHAEQELKESEERYRELADSITDIFFAMDEHMRYTYWNKASEILTGIRAEDALGESLPEIFPDTPGIKRAEKVYRDVLRTQQPQTFVTDYTDRDGRHYIFEISAYPSRGGISVFAKDITERKEMEEAIKQAAEEWKRTFDSISDAISIHDRDFRILQANKAFADLFGKSASEIIGKHCYELYKGEKPHLGCPQEQTLATKKPAAAEFYESRLGKCLRVSTSPIFNGKGKVAGIVHITRDITEQKQQNERLMMADRLASIGELAAGAAHELNNPLTSVIGFAQLLMEKDTPDYIRKDLAFIRSEAQRAANVMSNLLTFARKHTPVKQLNQINDIIEDVLKLRTYAHKSNRIRVERHLASDLPEIMVDYFQMQQVFLNIIINAEYFMTEAHKRGILTITTKKQNGKVMISIADDGPGIPEENLSRIFDPFFTTKEAGKGTGLGLSICHGIVAEHGGQIYAKSQLGQGATIVIELPINSH